MELAEPVEDLKLLVPTNCIVYPCGDHATVFWEVITVEPLDELAKLRDNMNNSVVRSCIKKLANCSEHEFLIHFRSNQILQLCFSLS